MKLTKLLCLLSVFIITLACDKARPPFKESQALVLIFEKIPYISDTCQFTSGSYNKTYEPEVTYYDNFIRKACVIDKTGENDTLTLYPANDQVIVRHRYDAYNYYEYLFKKGDSVVFSYEGNRSSASVINRKTLPYDLIFDHNIRRRFVSKRHTPLFQYLAASEFVDNTASRENISSQVKTIKSKAYEECIQLLKSENHFLDSLLRNNQMSGNVYDFYKNRNTNISLLLKVKENKLPQYQIENIIRQDSSASTEFPNMYYHLLLESFADKYIVEKTTPINFKDGVNRDYKEAYRKINGTSIFTQPSKEFLLTREINRIAKFFSRNDIKEYFGYYEKDVRDTAMINFIRNENFLKFEQGKSESNNLTVMSKDKEKLTLEDIRKANTGKVIFIDFWASWCAACREAIPFSSKLRSELKNTRIVFVYLSIDENFGAWKKASFKENLDEVTENYIVVNYETSDFIRNHVINVIPRYMIFNKDGALAYANAMSPESKDLKGILQRLEAN